MKTKMTTDPIAVSAAVVGAVKAVLGALVILGAVHLTGEQVAAVALAIEACLAVPAALFVKRRVTVR